MALTREQSLSKYGTEAYTAWDEAGAGADWMAKHPNINVLQKTPNPAQLTATTQPFQKIKGFTDLQNQYAEQLSKQPDYASMYKNYADQEGLTSVNKLITDIDTSVADIEDKIAKIEPNINKEIGDYLITEGQRGRMVTAEEQPLRTQYADILRSRSRLSAEAAAKANLVNTLMGYAQSDYQGKINYLKTLVDIEESNRAAKAATSNFSQYLGNQTPEPKPTTPPNKTTPSIDDIFSGVTIDKGGNIVTKTGNQQFDKYGNLILGGGIQLTPTQTPSSGKLFSTSTKLNRLKNTIA